MDLEAVSAALQTQRAEGWDWTIRTGSSEIAVSCFMDASPKRPRIPFGAGGPSQSEHVPRQTRLNGMFKYWNESAKSN
jgi:hypothetical protein